MEKCSKCEKFCIKVNRTYLYHDIHECTNCGNWEYIKIDECCREPSEIIVVDRRSHDLYFIRRQCLNCGGCTTSMTKPLSSRIFGKEIRAGFNFDTFHLWKAELNEERNDLFESKKLADFRKSKRYKYLEYLQSDVWKAKRKLVLERENDLCESCKNPAVDIHHLHYDNLYNEPLEDLQALCRPCHSRVHNKAPF